MSNWSGNNFVDSLLVGRKIGDSNIKVYFATYHAAWTNVEKTAAMNALQSWADVSNLTFSETSNRASADFVENLQNLSATPGALGVHDLVIDYNTSTITSHNLQLDGYFNYGGYGWDRNDASGGLSIGGNGYATLVHEFGHGLGLDHTHSDGSGDPHSFPGVSSGQDSGDHQLNQDVFSVMSYVDGINTKSLNGGAGQDNYGFIGGPMAFDIAAVQFMYGANTSKNAGNNTYTLPDSNTNGAYFSAIWDTGGVDKIYYNGSKDVSIDLRSATLQNEVGGGGFLSTASGIKGGFTIAADFTNVLTNENGETGVIIENATGGTGNDTITGNNVANIIYARQGNDVVSAGDGDDKVYDGSGTDTIQLGAGNDYIRAGGGLDSYDGGSGKDYISYYYSSNGVTLDLEANTASGSRASNDTINSFESASGSKTGDDNISGTSGSNTIRTYGGDDKVYDRGGSDKVELGSGDDYVRVGGGLDTYDGGSGKDYISYYDSTNGVTLDLEANTASGSWASNDTISGFESASGSKTGGDNIKGTSGANTIRTYGGDDKVYDLGGEDKVYLGDGDDYIRVGGGKDTYDGGDGKDYISYYDSTSGVILDLDQNIAAGSWASNDTISNFESASGSKTGDDEILGTSGENTIKTYGGDDVLNGRGGSDQLYAGSGNDLIFGGSGADIFHFEKDDDQDIIRDFEGIDTLSLEGFAFATAEEALTFASQVSDDVVFDFGGGDTLTIENVTKAGLLDDIAIV